MLRERKGERGTANRLFKCKVGRVGKKALLREVGEAEMAGKTENDAISEGADALYSSSKATPSDRLSERLLPDG